MDAELNPAQRLHTLGQSLWLDSINRVMLRTGTLARYVRDLAVTGLTSNPTILGHAMAAGSDYDSSLARLAADGVTDAQDLVYALALEDLAQAAALFRPAWEQTEGVDGYVSLEVPPDVAYDAAATVAFARRLHDQAGFPNLLVKIPGTPQGLTAMEEAITAGIGVNVTLLFSDTHYLRTADAYLRALERRRRAGLDLAVPSVASLFISRWDSAADPLLPPARTAAWGWRWRKRPTPPMCSCSRTSAGRRSPRQAPVRSGFCGPPPRPRTQTCPTPIIWAGWLPRTRSTPSRRRPCSPSPTTEASTTGWSPTTPPRNGPSRRPPTPASTPMRSLSTCSAREQAPSPRTGPRSSRQSKKRRQTPRPKAVIDPLPTRRIAVLKGGCGPPRGT